MLWPGLPQFFPDDFAASISGADYCCGASRGRDGDVYADALRIERSGSVRTRPHQDGDRSQSRGSGYGLHRDERANFPAAT